MARKFDIDEEPEITKKLENLIAYGKDSKTKSIC